MTRLSAEKEVLNIPADHDCELLQAPDKKFVQLSYQDYIEMKWQSAYWKAQHKKACERETILKEEIKQKDAKIRDLNQRLYGKKSEKKCSKPDLNPNDSTETEAKRKRGRQQGSPSHPRTPQPNLPIVSQTYALDETTCQSCGLQYSPLPEEVSDIMEVAISAHIRRIKRQKCVINCACRPGPKIITAPLPPKLIPRSLYGNSIWEEILLKKFLHGQPVNRTLNDFKSIGLNMSPGTVACNLKNITPMFKPIYEAFHQQQMTENQFHNDETRWEVYEQVEGKEGHRWYLWVTRSKSVVYYCIDPTRSAAVPLAHFSTLTSKNVIVVCDRYSAYKKLARLNLAIILAFCWAHVRRDFLDLAKSHTDLNDWGLDWVEQIGNLYHLNQKRLELFDANLTLVKQSSLFQKSHRALYDALVAMKSVCGALLDEDNAAQKRNGKLHGSLKTPQRKVLNSLQEHWQGLTVFYEHPEINMDNNVAEQSIRNPVVGRKGYYGSGSLWSADLAAMMFSIFQTIILWGLNPRTWLHHYLEACALNNGKPPEDLCGFLPWRMSDERIQHMEKPPKLDSS